MIIPLGMHVMKVACREAAGWQSIAEQSGAGGGECLQHSADAGIICGRGGGSAAADAGWIRICCRSS